MSYITEPKLVWAISMVRIWIINEFIPILSFLDLLIKANLSVSQLIKVR